MKMPIALAISTSLLFGCMDGLSVDYDSRRDVVIEGVPHVVFALRVGGNTYYARESDLTGGRVDPNDFRQNVLAIEAVTGCQVDRSTITNAGLVTTAQVKC
ncbi:hypothetical protein [Pseudopelagicola sp. nBUS_19]|uniref:hypothetical protein n=1 Tax=Pseudopelagicola sp. nBUS_19 TaxID=3395316 RepID=UPI003EBC1B14